MIYERHNLEEFIKTHSEQKYKEFSQKIILTKYPMNGIRMPIVKKHAKYIFSCENAKEFFDWDILCYEQVLLQGYLIGYFKNDEKFENLLIRYVKKIDDWSLCDGPCCAIKRKDDEYFELTRQYSISDDMWQARWGIVSLMTNFWDKPKEALYDILNNINATGYYLDMAAAWFLQVIAAKDSQKAEYIIKNTSLNGQTRKMAIGKIRDSFRIDKENKKYFKELLQNS